MSERVVLAYSGGLDTSVAIGWIADATQAEVVAVAVGAVPGAVLLIGVAHLMFGWRRRRRLAPRAAP